MKPRMRKPTGVLAELLADIDHRELAKTRKRMMLAAKIDEAMRKCGYNQTQFARLMGKSPAVISEWLSGDRNFTTDTLASIEDALGIRLLDVSLMTAIKANTEIYQKVHAGHTSEMSLNGAWQIGIIYGSSDYNVNCA